MRRLLCIATLLAAISGCSDSYDRNDLELITAFTAKQMCTCVFVMNHDEAFCRNWVAESPPVATVSVNLADQTTEAEALLMWGASAHFVSERFGCLLD